ncbi:MAG: amidohydrolase [Verrucomicrobiota bacterium]
MSSPELFEGATGLKVDLIVTNGLVHTMEPGYPRAGALAVIGSRIAAIGSARDIGMLASSKTRVIDAGGRLVLPGFNDSHVHFLAGGFSLNNLDLRSAESPEEFTRRVEVFARSCAAGTWIQGGDWDHENWPGSPLPDRSMVDCVSGHPVFVTRLDGHMGLANSLALRLAGVTRETKDPPGGLIVRDPRSGEPTGVLKDTAMDFITRVIPPPGPEERHRAALAATRHAAELGVTSVTDVSADDDIGLYQKMAEDGELKNRIYGTRSIVNWEVSGRAGIRAGFGNDWVRSGGIKGFSDGSLGSLTALFVDPYADDPGNRGLLFDQMLPEGIMLERTLGADRAGLQVMIHAIGDAANQQVLDIFAAVAEANGPRDRRCRVEHAQHLRREDIARFGNLGVIASMQPYHAADDGRWCEKRLGRERCAQAYAFRSLLDTGAVLAFGSDWTVAPLNPLTGIKASVTRQTLDGKNPDGWVPEEKITVEEAVRAYTMGSAFAEFAEHQKGSLVPGKLADFVILEEDIFAMDPSGIDRVRVLCTVVGGRVVHEI